MIESSPAVPKHVREFEFCH